MWLVSSCFDFDITAFEYRHDIVFLGVHGFSFFFKTSVGLAWWNLDWEAGEEKRFCGCPRSTRHRDLITNEVFTSGLLVTRITYYIIYTAETQATKCVWNSL